MHICDIWRFYHQQSQTPSHEHGWGFLYTKSQLVWTCPVLGNKMPEEHKEPTTAIRITMKWGTSNSQQWGAGFSGWCSFFYLFIEQHLYLSHQVVFCFSHIGVIRSQFGLVDLQCSHVVILDLVVLALVLTKQGKVVQLLSHIWVVLAQNLDTNQGKPGVKTTVRSFIQ